MSKDFLTDEQNLKAILDQLPQRDRSVYDSYRSLSKLSCFPGRILVVYTLAGGQPTDVSLLACGDLEVTRLDGPLISLRDQRREEIIDVVPSRWRNRDIFFHAPQHFEFRWSGKQTNNGVQFAPHYAILIKTRSAERFQIEGDTYCTTLNLFNERFPEHKVRY